MRPILLGCLLACGAAAQDHAMRAYAPFALGMQQPAPAVRQDVRTDAQGRPYLVAPGPGQSCFKSYESFRAYCDELVIAERIAWRDYTEALKAYEDLSANFGGKCPGEICLGMKHQMESRAAEYLRLCNLELGIVTYVCADGWLLKDQRCYIYTVFDIPVVEKMEQTLCSDSLVRPGHRICSAPAIVR